MSLIRVGSNSKFADGWDAAFGGKKAKVTKASKKKAASPKKKAAKKKSKK